MNEQTINRAGNELIALALAAGRVNYNRHGVGSFQIADEDAAAFSFDRLGLCDGVYGADGSFQIRRRKGARAAYVMFND